ncbi:MAG: chorismate synthase [Chloroflexota bacterium]|nr:chorismate synthase [Chloroflexota bacterium]
MIRFLTAGESHGPALIGILEGMPAGLEIEKAGIDADLIRRQGGYGRSGRQRIEHDRVDILTGLERDPNLNPAETPGGGRAGYPAAEQPGCAGLSIAGRTTGAPIALRIENRDYANQVKRDKPTLTIPRPGHADLAGATKYRLDDMRTVLERASARETAMRVAVGAIVKQLLAAFGMRVTSRTLEIGGISGGQADLRDLETCRRIEESQVRVADPTAERVIVERIDRARRDRDTLGGIFEVKVFGVPVGLGSYVQWDRKLDGCLAQAVMSIQAIKGVEIGDAFDVARSMGTLAHDQIVPGPKGPQRLSNRAGGLEGGVTNGEPLVVRAAMKPISTTLTPMRSIDVKTGDSALAQYQRSDICAVPAASVVGEAMVALVVADAFLEKFGGDSIAEICERYKWAP